MKRSLAASTASSNKILKGMKGEKNGSTQTPKKQSDASVQVMWFRNDLRLTDNKALVAACTAAAENSSALVPIYIYDTWATGTTNQIGSASNWWLHHSLTALSDSLVQAGCGPLVLRKGDPLDILPSLCSEMGATSVHYSIVYEPRFKKRDEGKLFEKLSKLGISLQGHTGQLLIDPEEIKNGQGSFFKVFTPFWRACLSQRNWPGTTVEAPLELLRETGYLKNERSKGGVGMPKSDQLSSWELLPVKPNWAKGFTELWTPGEAGGLAKLDAFLKPDSKGGAGNYAIQRDIMANQKGTSKMSPHLHYGEVSPLYVFRAVQASDVAKGNNLERYIAELGWREFNYYLHYHVPELDWEPFQPKFKKMKWAHDRDPKEAKVALKKWQKGLTGYPIVDAAMRELYATGWMHNRCRMIVGSFLTKDLLIRWTHGASWFQDTLVDHDVASNSGGWQWVAGTGADASPYFRIFNPITQSKKFDPKGEYIRKWVPELSRLSNADIHEPWKLSKVQLKVLGIEKGVSYPNPMVDHSKARDKALGPQGYGILKAL
eukprot:Nk52_evm56s212 gene=Nk52_evmTU56s212